MWRPLRSAHTRWPGTRREGALLTLSPELPLNEPPSTSGGAPHFSSEKKSTTTGGFYLSMRFKHDANSEEGLFPTREDAGVARLGPRSSCSSSLCRSAVLVWMLRSSCSLRRRISSSSSLRSTAPWAGPGSGVGASRVASPPSAQKSSGKLISHPVLQLVVFLRQLFTLRPALLQFVRPPGQSLAELLSLLLLLLPEAVVGLDALLQALAQHADLLQMFCQQV
ncbi:hypothetical protein EYF80_031075 [Liparis tanakae]|uniref:Uncharacterized protein n=1 Tax=Liparis tanakae TaxID=230148 RepID=A0A4Z2GZC5_9TELE|nr:hypothetical protein EYF80_031075 [Liparis tanakae]